MAWNTGANTVMARGTSMEIGDVRDTGIQKFLAQAMGIEITTAQDTVIETGTAHGTGTETIVAWETGTQKVTARNTSVEKQVPLDTNQLESSRVWTPGTRAHPRFREIALKESWTPKFWILFYLAGSRSVVALSCLTGDEVIHRSDVIASPIKEQIERLWCRLLTLALLMDLADTFVPRKSRPGKASSRTYNDDIQGSSLKYTDI